MNRFANNNPELLWRDALQPQKMPKPNPPQLNILEAELERQQTEWLCSDCGATVLEQDLTPFGSVARCDPCLDIYAADLAQWEELS